MTERTLTEKKYSYNGLFCHLAKSEKLHVSLKCYSKGMVQTTCSHRNRIEGCDPLNNKFATSTTEKKGFITITRRY